MTDLISCVLDALVGPLGIRSRAVRRLKTALSVLSLVCLHEGVARASPQARLVYGRSGVAESCPDESALRRAVAARIGYDPFFAVAPRTVIVTITPKGPRLVARVQLVDDDGHAQGARELDSARGDCGGLFDTVALTISIAIDPHALAGPSPPPSPPPPEPAAPALPSPPALALSAPVPDEAIAAHDASPQPVPATASLRLGAELRGAYGLEPGPAAGAAAYAGASWKHASVGMELEVDLPASDGFGARSSVTAWLLAGSLVPCLRLEPLEACALFVVGRIDATANGVVNPDERVAAYVGVGGRIGVEVPIAPRLSLRAHGDLLGNVHETVLLVGSLPAWTAPPVGGVLGVGAVASF
jgi:hypothetical protein